MEPIKPPAPNPCGSCPYRKDVPSGLWHPAEYLKLPEYEKETGEQPPTVFLCHQQDGRACAGWVATHDMVECLGLRIASAVGTIADEDLDAFLDYETQTPLWPSGEAAARHGLKDVRSPSKEAQKAIHKLTARQAREKGRSE
jgi:hypothetical protein